MHPFTVDEDDTISDPDCILMRMAHVAREMPPQGTMNEPSEVVKIVIGEQTVIL